ncbi:unnamed protein product [Cladocopium goreaui]|uniref:Exo-beta-1,3-glucanase (Gluca n 1,3-beta-glucosidase) (Laminarinase) (SacteLam55A) n=1 Tax=Cladocopium goreaui TaxID=2562237 RepID=A0A9P1GIN3_9DINO|nr:unnamed protein product [Cladocopium goreaui]
MRLGRWSFGLWCCFSWRVFSEPNPPVWPQAVHIFAPEDAEDRNLTAEIATLLKDLNNVTTGHYSSERIALLFKPGSYDVDIEVGYYVQVLGLGRRPQEVAFTGRNGVYSPPMGESPDPGSLDNFWRSAENFHQKSSEGMLWAVSQACPLRRVHVDRNLSLFAPKAWASGGYLADVHVDGYTRLGGQQQWIMRNSNISTPNASILGGQWNIVLVGCTGTPPTTLPHSGSVAALTNVALTPVVAEKPFISIDSSGLFFLEIPEYRYLSVGPSFQEEGGTTAVPFSEVYVARSSDASSAIQAKLDLGLHVVLTPGIYNLTQPLTLSTSGQVLLGIGMATLVAPKDGRPCVYVKGLAKGVRVAGLMLQAAASKSTLKVVPLSSLLEWGEAGELSSGDAAAPGVLSDIFARVGGPDFDRSIGVDVVLRIHSNHVVGDNLWIWRADHAFLDPDQGPQKDPQNSLVPLKDRVPKGSEYYLTAMGDYPAKVGVQVKGDFVTIYGLAVEHFTQDNTVWEGEAGRVYFYQNELPYDVDQENFGDKHYAGYRVASMVQRHEAHGVGVYSYFRDFQCLVRSGFVAPSTDGVRFTNIFTRFLNGEPGIEHVLNDQGSAVMGFSDPMSRLPTSVQGPGPTAAPKHRGMSLWSLMLGTAIMGLSLGWLSSFFFVRWRSRQRGAFIDGASDSESDKC